VYIIHFISIVEIACTPPAVPNPQPEIQESYPLQCLCPPPYNILPSRSLWWRRILIYYASRGWVLCVHTYAQLTLLWINEVGSAGLGCWSDKHNNIGIASPRGWFFSPKRLRIIQFGVIRRDGLDNPSSLTPRTSTLDLNDFGNVAAACTVPFRSRQLRRRWETKTAPPTRFIVLSMTCWHRGLPVSLYSYYIIIPTPLQYSRTMRALLTVKNKWNWNRM